MLTLKRTNAYGLQHPWRFAAAGFLFVVLLYALVLVLSGRNLFGDLPAGYGVMVGIAIGTSARRRRVPFWQKALVAPLLVGGFLILGWTVQVTGLLPR